MNLVTKLSVPQCGRGICIPQQSVYHGLVSATSRQLLSSHKGNSARVPDSERLKSWSMLLQIGGQVWTHFLTQNPTNCLKFMYVSFLLCEVWIIVAPFPVKCRIIAFKLLGMTLIILSVNSCY